MERHNAYLWFIFPFFVFPLYTFSQTPIEWNGVTYQPKELPQYHPPLNNAPNFPIQYHAASQTAEIITDTAAITTFEQLTGYNPLTQQSGLTEIDLPQGQGRVFSNLSLINNTQDYPWSANVKIFMTFPSGGNYVCSGSMIDPKHVLTAGHCVYDAAEGGWASEIFVVPGFNDFEAPFGPRTATNWGSWAGWTTNEDFDWDMGYIELDQPVGALSGWFGMHYNNSNSFYTSNTFNNAGYPSASPYDGLFQYFWVGNYDYVIDQVLYHNNIAYGGQSGSNTYHINSSNDRIVHSVLSHGNDAVPYTGHVRINSTKFNDVVNFMNNHIPSTYDLTPLNTRVAPGSVAAGAYLTDLRFLVHNYSAASFSGAVSVSVYLSTNSTISDQDILIGTLNFNNANLGAKASSNFFVS
ncbi:MAG: trypsin-like serine protease, partial [Saprospiraceae bacterium]|nr:trypsin-like serine protease [Saprospiraceae bacterium]